MTSKAHATLTKPPGPKKVQVQPGRWVCEQAFWMHWKTRGILETTTPSELLTVKMEGFEKLICNYSEVIEFMQHYSQEVWALLASCESDELSDLETGIDPD